MATKSKVSRRPFSRKFSSYQTEKGKKATAKYPELENMSLEEGTEYLRGMRTTKKKPRQRRKTKTDTFLSAWGDRVGKYTPGPSGK